MRDATSSTNSSWPVEPAAVSTPTTMPRRLANHRLEMVAVTHPARAPEPTPPTTPHRSINCKPAPDSPSRPNSGGYLFGLARGKVQKSRLDLRMRSLSAGSSTARASRMAPAMVASIAGAVSPPSGRPEGGTTDSSWSR